LTQNILYFAYRTFIGIGTKPTQLMRALIDIEWADLIIPSVNCTQCDHLLKYNSSSSATYEANGTELVVGRGGEHGKGFVSQDTLAVGDGIHVPHLPFLEANYTSPTFLEGAVDTVIGLAIDKPRYLESSHHFLPSPFATLVKENVLDRNIVSILLPRNDDDLGDIMFGDLDEALYEGDLSSHPLYPSDTTQWQIEANSVKVSDQNGTVFSEESLPGYTARLHTFFPFIVLPPTIGEVVVNSTGADCSDGCQGCKVPCDQLHELPYVTFNLGGHNFTITGEDYAVKTDITWPFCRYSVRCELLIGPGANDYLEPETIDLGSSFLRGIYSAYDFDARSVQRMSIVKTTHVSFDVLTG